MNPFTLITTAVCFTVGFVVGAYLHDRAVNRENELLWDD